MIIKKTWAMPNKATFSIKPIKDLIYKYKKVDKVWVDPFSGTSTIAEYNNDLNPKLNRVSKIEACDYLKRFPELFFDGCLFDPPYSPRQIKECYDSVGLVGNTRSDFWSRVKSEIQRVVKPEGIVISFGWNSGGIGKKLGFETIEIMLVAHGGHHNDTIVTVEKKLK